SELFNLDLSPGKFLAAVPDSETLSLAEDCPTIADALRLPAEGAYFNCGVMLMNLDELRKQHFLERAVEFLNRKSAYRFWDQSAINFLLYGQIHALPECWNRASWCFDAQQNNDLDCVIHYTTSAPWLVETAGPAQVLFERFAAEVGLPVNRRSPLFRKSMRQRFWRTAIAPLRAPPFPLNRGTEHGDCCLRRRPSICEEWMWCICTRWLTGSTFPTGWTRCRAGWAS